MKRLLIAAAFLIFVGAGVYQITHHKNVIKLKEIQIKSTEIKLKELDQKYDQELEQKDVNEQRIKQLEQEKQELEKQLQAKADAKLAEQARIAAAARIAQPVAAAAPAQGPIAGCGDNSYANYIYMHESGCNPSAVNSSGCRGIGQACPGSKLPCGADYACQNAWFTNYAMQRYGSWEAAYNFWLSHRWW